MMPAIQKTSESDFLSPNFFNNTMFKKLRLLTNKLIKKQSISELIQSYWPVFILLTASLILFSYTVLIRRPWFGQYFQGHHFWLTGVTIKYVKYWLQEGIFSLNFAMVDNPPSVEFLTLASRVFYVSYSPMTLIPIYTICKIFAKDVSPSIVVL